MPNKELKGRYYNCPINGKQYSYDHLRKLKSEFENSDGNYDLEMKNWVEKTLGDSSDAIYNEKKSRMKAGEENQFKKTHTKDRDNADPTAIRLPNIAKSSNHEYIMANKTVYESINDELNSIRYLIEYMNNYNK